MLRIDLAASKGQSRFNEDAARAVVGVTGIAERGWSVVCEWESD